MATCFVCKRPVADTPPDEQLDTPVELGETEFKGRMVRIWAGTRTYAHLACVQRDAQQQPVEHVQETH